jgi:hypothetical protein
MHDYSYSARWNGANPPALEERIAQFADQIAAALRTEVDEVLVRRSAGSFSARISSMSAPLIGPGTMTIAASPRGC